MEDLGSSSDSDEFDVLKATSKQLFEGDIEEIWILNFEEVQFKEVLQYYPPMPEPPKPPPPPPKPGPMVIRVPMCCVDCQGRVESHLNTLSGIQKYTCDWVEQKVTIIGAEKDPIAVDVLLSSCRKLFKKSEIW